MNNLKYLSLLVFILLLSCKKEVDVIEDLSTFPPSVRAVVLKIEGSIWTYREMYSIARGNTFLPHATVKLIYDGLVLDEVQASVDGRFSFEEQAIPLGKTFIHVEALDYFPTIRKVIESDSLSSYSLHMIPKLYTAINDHAIDQEKPMIRITGNIVKLNKGDVVYALDADGNLIGNTWINSNLPHELDFSTMADEEIYLYIRYAYCTASTPIKIGPFSVDTNIGDALFEDLMQEEYVTISGSLEVCNGIETRGRIHFFQDGRYLGNTATTSINTYSWNLQTCSLTDRPITVIASYINDTTYEFYNYGKAVTTYLPDQDIVADIEICNPNTTNFTYSLNGGPSLNESALTIARIDQRGVVNIFVDNATFSSNYRIRLSGTNLGTQIGDVYLIENYEVVGFAEDINFMITSNSGEMLEGSFQGTIMDNNYGSLGNITGSFQALVQ